MSICSKYVLAFFAIATRPFLKLYCPPALAHEKILLIFRQNSSKDNFLIQSHVDKAANVTHFFVVRHGRLFCLVIVVTPPYEKFSTAKCPKKRRFQLLLDRKSNISADDSSLCTGYLYIIVILELLEECTIIHRGPATFAHGKLFYQRAHEH